MEQLIENKFNYNQLQPEIAEFLKDKETNMKEIVGSAYTRIGKELKEAQDKLSQNGYGCFQEWYESLGFKKNKVYNLINRYELIVGNTNNQNLIEDLPLSLTYEISKESADPELKQQVLDGNITSHKKFKELKKEKEELEEKKKQAEQRAESAGNMYEKIRREKEELEQKEPEVIEKVEEVEVIPETVQQRIKELEERIGDLKKYKNDIKNYKQKKNEVDKELNELLEYKRSLKEESDIAAQRAEIVQGVRGKVNKIINEKGSLEQLFKKDVELRNVDLYNINEMADSLTEISQLIYEYVNSQNKNEEGEIVDV